MNCCCVGVERDGDGRSVKVESVRSIIVGDCFDFGREGVRMIPQLVIILKGEMCTSVPVDAENWISHMEKIFDVMGCEDAFMTRLAVYKFEGNALAWWKAYKQAKGGDAWLERLKRKYHSIRQTSTETSTEFMQHFLRLAGFLGAAVGTEEEQAKNFQWCLHSSTLNGLIGMVFTQECCRGQDMALPSRDHMHQYLRFEGLLYTDTDIADFEERLGRIYNREIWLFHLEIRGISILDLRVWGYTDADITDFEERLVSVSEVRRRMIWREFILGMSLHTAEEIESVGFGAYWAESARQIPDKGDLSV
nr:hypothetical protein [Tanacetum cinerariifolium]